MYPSVIWRERGKIAEQYIQRHWRSVPMVIDNNYTLSCCFCLFGFNVVFNHFSVISRRCLVATGSSMLTFIVLPHWSIMPQTLDMLHTQSGRPVLALPRKSEQLVTFLTTLVCRGPGKDPWPPVPRRGHSTLWAARASTPSVYVVVLTL